MGGYTKLQAWRDGGLDRAVERAIGGSGGVAAARHLQQEVIEEPSERKKRKQEETSGLGRIALNGD